MYIKTLIANFPYCSAFFESFFNNMAPNNQFTGVLNETDAQTIDGGLLVDVTELKHAHKRNIKLNWRNITLFVVVHLQAVYGLWLIFSSAKVLTFIFGKRQQFGFLSKTTRHCLNSKMCINMALLLFSVFPVHHVWIWHNGGQSSIVGASQLQGTFSVARYVDDFPNDGLPGFGLSLGA